MRTLFSRMFLLSFLIAGELTSYAQSGSSVPQLHYVSLRTPEDLRQYLHYTPTRKALISAHRGGPAAGYPENCLATFDNTLQFLPAIIECDVSLSRDAQLVMMHDETVDRTTNGTGKVGDKTYAELQALRLEDGEGRVTIYRIPTLTEVLDWARYKAVLTIDVKKGVPASQIVAAIRHARAESYVAVITYTLETAREYHRLSPDLMLSVTVRNAEELARLEASGIPLDRVVAFVGVNEPQPELYQQLHAKGIRCILGTMGNLDQKAAARTTNVYAELIKNGADILSTDRPLEAAQAIKSAF